MLTQCVEKTMHVNHCVVDSVLLILIEISTESDYAAPGV